MRGVFFDESDALAVVAALVREGWGAHVTRERLAGEDDDEGHPWAVVTDAPEIILDVLVDRYEGWLDPDDLSDGPPASPLPPLDLPRGPRRAAGERD